MNRITTKQLQAICDRINRVTNSPMEPWTRIDGQLTANIGNYHLDGAYGGYALEQMVNESGGVRSVFGCGHIPKRELADRMYAFLAGLETKAA